MTTHYATVIGFVAVVGQKAGMSAAGTMIATLETGRGGIGHMLHDATGHRTSLRLLR